MRSSGNMHAPSLPHPPVIAEKTGSSSNAEVLSSRTPLRVLVIDGHPRADSLCAGLAMSFVRGAETAGHPVRLICVRDLQFDLNARGQPLEPDIAEFRDLLIRDADPQRVEEVAGPLIFGHVG